jgi:hypothetical protein
MTSVVRSPSEGGPGSYKPTFIPVSTAKGRQVRGIDQSIELSTRVASIVGHDDRAAEELSLRSWECGATTSDTGVDVG